MSGRGRVLSWTTVTHQLHDAFPTPYTVVLVALDEYPKVHMVGHLPGTPVVRPDHPAEVWFEELGDDATIPQWRLVGTGP